MTEKTTVNAMRRAMVAGAAAAALAGPRAAVAQGPSGAKTFVLVHGASQGGWCWRRVSDRLERLGHKVFTPTLTGLGERSHLMSRDVDLDMHITDVVNVIKWESLQGIVLVGHSYGGWVVSGVAEQILPAISSIVFLDAFMPENGQKGLDLNSERSKAEIALALKKGDISRPAPSIPAAMMPGPAPVTTIHPLPANAPARSRAWEGPPRGGNTSRHNLVVM